MSAQLWEASLGLHLWGTAHSSFPAADKRSFLWVQLLQLPQPHPQHVPQLVATWDGEGSAIQSFTILGDAAVYG